MCEEGIWRDRPASQKEVVTIGSDGTVQKLLIHGITGRTSAHSSQLASMVDSNPGYPLDIVALS